MLTHYFFVLLFSGKAQIHNTPPVLVAVPRTLQLPLDTKVRKKLKRKKTFQKKK
jgi:hypothetical protein